ncbi:hypothetical protein GIB67_025525 [Kingdonia uniflora]|uniref:Cytochrome P450 n=1 Tax=Kingdonia uniflora TaxID=39325 RepID=A0A7J7M087_9MAGN|nr:hypothetical protein GIB67_025525 [Kingdonia uniflora]
MEFSAQYTNIFSILALSVATLVTVHSLRQQKLHGLPVWPIIGMLPSLLLGLRSGLHEWFTMVLNRQNGTFIMKGPWFSSLNWVVTSCPTNLEYLLKTKFSNFPKGEHVKDIMRDVFGDGMFNIDDAGWFFQKKALSKVFNSKKFRDLTAESVLHLIHEGLLPILEDQIEKYANPIIDLQDVLLRFTFDNVCMIGLGIDPGSLKLGMPEIPFVKAFEDATELTFYRFFLPTFIWKSMRYLNLGFERELKQSTREVFEWMEHGLCKHNIDVSSESNEKRFMSDIISTFSAFNDDKGTPFPEISLRDNGVGLILAGRDTSSVALTWFFWLLDQNPEAEEKVLEEIRGIVGERENCSIVEFKPHELKRMEYLHAALSETLRLYPSVPVDIRKVFTYFRKLHLFALNFEREIFRNENFQIKESTSQIKSLYDIVLVKAREEDMFPDGTIIRKGARIFYSIYAMGRMESVWGEDCREFKPERWLKDGRFVSEPAFKFAAFNAGPRACIGKDFAYYQMKSVAASIVYRYHIKVVKDHPVVPKPAFALYLKYGLKVTISRRKHM